MPTGSPMPAPLRRRALPVLVALGHARPAAAQAEAWRAAWAAFQSRFVAPEGRVIDTGNGGVSHTEGQGWGMLFALRAQDRQGFERLLAWTRRTLARPGDSLHAWRYRPDGGLRVDDLNNATDGDLCIAWALLEAGARWRAPEHHALGSAIGRDVLRLLVRQAGSISLLLPGALGFERADRFVINPSYYVFPAFRWLARAVPDPAWARLAADGLLLLRQARFGRWELPPDWLEVDRRSGIPAIAQAWPPRFSYDAVRVPLWLGWAGLRDEPTFRNANRFWSGRAALPAWVDLTSDVSSPYSASAGVAALAQLVAGGSGTPALPSPRSLLLAQKYYDAALTMLAAAAAEGNQPAQD
ncbi:glycosyl hydrolase family 8 [Paracraurococcus lichenis]|uniref:Glucanase n=1 Tax=Paracraurococcus lichenis TaxID=3064888 RepID=A0ABT9DW28_9PROT|nr:glycosyl hydrolase family 8 [Paracraurococcus sp. LOR1-02]MDO9708078.1 glycosyl hydrolase family 8 [Paracraurococcus sp. LOR1-02]